jgi:hypothetical protein
MPSFAEIVKQKKEYVDCIDEAKKLLIGKVVKVGDKYGWTSVYGEAFNTQDLFAKLEELFNRYGFTVVINVNNQFEITGTI